MAALRMTTDRRAPDYLLMATVGGLVLVGLVMVYSASFVEAFTSYQNQYYYLVRQCIGAVIGVAGMIIAERIDYRLWQKYSIQFVAVIIILLVAVLVLPASITTVNNSKSWLRLGGGLISVQPTEIAKLAMIVYFANWLSKRGEQVSNVTRGLVPFAVMLGFVCGLIMLQPDLGTTVTIVLIASVIYFAAGANVFHVATALGIGAIGFWLIVEVIGLQNMRIEAFKDPWKYYSSFGYQPIHALYALGSGGFFGEGLGQGRQKFNWLPQAHTDTIFAIIGEEFGMIGSLIVIGAFLMIAWRGYSIARKIQDPFGALVAIGITSWFIFQAMINIAVVTSLIPFTGLTLPFLSYGNTSLIMCMVATGVLLNISKFADGRPVEDLYGGQPRAVPTATARASKRVEAPPLPLWRRNWRTRVPSAGGRNRATSSNQQSGAAERVWDWFKQQQQQRKRK